MASRIKQKKYSSPYLKKDSQNIKMEKNIAREILDILEKTYPDARILLNYRSPFELLIATILAAQCTDERVNRVTSYLFKKYPDVQSFASAKQDVLENDIKPTGFYRNKAKNIIACSSKLLKRYNGIIPRSIDKLIELPGIGRKTANVVLANAFGKQAIAVDTHVLRVSQRIGLASSKKKPDEIETRLNTIFPHDKWTKTTHLLSFHGRRICIARKPLCGRCPIFIYCEWNKKYT